MLWVSHDRGEVFRNCRRVCVIDRGRSQPVTTLGELFRSPGTEAAARLSGCKNYADARPREDAVFLPDWGLTLSCSRPVPEASAGSASGPTMFSWPVPGRKTPSPARQ